MSGKEWVVSLIERVRQTINKYDIFGIHVPVLTTAKFILYIVSQFTTNAPNIPHLNNYSYWHA